MGNLIETICNNYIRIARESGLSDRAIGQKIGVTDTTIQRWKKLKNPPSEKHIEEMAELFKVDPFDFYKPEKVSTKPFAETLSVSMLRDLLSRKIDSIPDDIFELASELNDLDNQEWKTVKIALEVAINKKELNKIKKNG